MEKSEEKPGQRNAQENTPKLARPAHPADLLAATFEAIAAPSRRGVTLYGLPREQLIVTVIVLILLGIPFAAIIAFLPFWDWIGEVAFFKKLNSYLCPAIDALSYEYRPPDFPRFHIKRFLTGITTLIELVFFSNFIILLSRKVRKHLLLVWICYDRQKLITYFAISGSIFCGLWFLWFSDWSFLSFIHGRGGGNRAQGMFDVYTIPAMPVAALVFGHLMSIIFLGIWRAIVRNLW